MKVRRKPSKRRCCCPKRGGRGARGLGFQVAVHALVSAVLLQAGGLDVLGPNPQPEPPDAELGEPAESAGGKGLAIVGADPLREPVRAEQPAEDLLGRGEQRPLEPVTGEEIAGVGVLAGEWIAVAAIPQLELALEVDGPDDIGPGDRGLRAVRMRPHVGAAATDAAMAHQDPVNGGDGRHRLARMRFAEELVELAGAPAPGPAELEDLPDHG